VVQRQGVEGMNCWSSC